MKKLILLLLYFPLHASAQDSTIPLIKIPQVNLFCMLNQSIYDAKDTILISSWVLNRDRALMQEQNCVYYLLTDPIERKVVSGNRWYMENGFSGGWLPIPDTIETGIYWFMAYTNSYLEHGPQPVFRQQLDIHGFNGWPFNVIMDTMEEKPDSIYIHYKIGTRYKGLASGGTLEYHVWQMADSLTSGVSPIDNFGEAMIPISRKRIVMDYELYNSIQVGFIVTRHEERGRFIRAVKWKPKYGL